MNAGHARVPVPAAPALHVPHNNHALHVPPCTTATVSTIHKDLGPRSISQGPSDPVNTPDDTSMAMSSHVQLGVNGIEEPGPLEAAQRPPGEGRPVDAPGVQTSAEAQGAVEEVSVGGETSR